MNLLKFKSSHKPKSQVARILELLKRAGGQGVYNYELSRVCLSWHRRITDLRKSGEHIQSVRLKRGIYKYYYHETNVSGK